MPLEPGCSDEVISRNISEMIRNGHPRDQAIAAAYENCREGKELKADDAPTNPDDWAYVPDKDKPSLWKLRIDDEAHISQAIDALSGDKNAPHGRGVDIPADARAAVVSKISGAIGRLNVSDDRKAELRDKLAPHRSKELYITPKPLGLFDQRAGLTIYKSADGRRYLFIVSSNAYKDREQETVATKALKNYVDAAWAVEDKSLPRNPLLFMHAGEPIGDIVWTDLKGPFLVEVARERPDKRIRLSNKHLTTVKHVWDMIEQSKMRWGASQGFRHFPEDKDKEGTYHRIYKFETSILPLENAANQYTFSGVINMKSRDQVLDELLKMPKIGESLTRGIQAVKRELDKRGLTHKELVSVEKGKLDDALAIIEAALAKIGTVPEGFAAETLQSLVSAMAAGDTVPADDTAMDSTATDTTYMEADGEVPSPETEQAMSKQLDLMDRLIKSQAAIVTDNSEIQKSVKATSDALLALANGIQPLPQTLKALDDRLAAVEARLSGAPRRAATAPETVVNDEELTRKAKEQTARLEELFPGTGIMLTPKPNTNGGR